MNDLEKEFMTSAMNNWMHRATRAEAELAKLRALCAERPKPPSDAYVEDGVAWESYYSCQEAWESRVDAAGRGEGEK